MTKPSIPNSESVVLKVGEELAEKFNKHISLSPAVIARAEAKAEEFKVTLVEGLRNDILQAQNFYKAYLIDSNAENLIQLKRLVLSLKSNAGMADYVVVTETASLLFELFDDGYNMANQKVKNSILLYLQTIADMLTKKVNTDNSDEVQRLLQHFRELNRQLR